MTTARTKFFYFCVDCGAEYATVYQMAQDRRCDSESDEGEPCNGFLDEHVAPNLSRETSP